MLLLSPIGCADLFKSLEVDERTDPSLSLLFGTVRITSSPLSFDEIAFERMDPPPREEVLVSNGAHFRLFRHKFIHQGAFVVPNLPPGTYRLSWLRDGLHSWYADEASSVTVEIREPGVYDIGALVIHEDKIAAESWPDQTSRYAPLLAAVRSTAWEPTVLRLAQAARTTSAR